MNYFNFYNVPSYGNGKPIIARAKAIGRWLRNVVRPVKATNKQTQTILNPPSTTSRAKAF